jgi:hypothetical protein
VASITGLVLYKVSHQTASHAAVMRNIHMPGVYAYKNGL